MHARIRIEAELLASENEGVAERGLYKAMEVAREQESLSLELRAALSLSRLQGKTNRASRGKRVLKQVFERFTEGSGTSDLEAARTELEMRGAEV